MPAGGTRRRREIALDVEKGRTRDVPFEVEVASATGFAELPAAVHELVSHVATVAASSSYFTVVENERLTFAPWNLEVIEPLNRLLWAPAGSCQVQDDLPLLELEWLLARSNLPESFA